MRFLCRDERLLREYLPLYGIQLFQQNIPERNLNRSEFIISLPSLEKKEHKKKKEHTP